MTIAESAVDEDSYSAWMQSPFPRLLVMTPTDTQRSMSVATGDAQGLNRFKKKKSRSSYWPKNPEIIGESEDLLGSK